METRLRALMAAATLSFSCPLQALAQQPPVLPISNAVEIDLLACDWTPGPGVAHHQDGLSREETLNRVRDGIEWWRTELRERGRDINIREITVDAGVQSPRQRHRRDLSRACQVSAAQLLRPDAVQVIVTFPPNELFGNDGIVVLDAGRAPSTLSSATVSHELGHGLSLAHTGASVVRGIYPLNPPAPPVTVSRVERQLARLRPVRGSTYDLVWQDNSGQIVVWPMRGSVGLTALEIARPPGDPNWVAVGVGDFNSGGDDEILFQNDRNLSVWSIDSFRINFDDPIFSRSYFSIQAPNGQALAPIDADIAALGDFDGAGGGDHVLWRTRPGPGTPLNTYFPWSLQEGYVQRGSDPNDRTELFDLTRTADYTNSFAADINGDGRDEIGTVLNNGVVRITALQPQAGRDFIIEGSRTLTTLEPGWTLIGAVDSNSDGFDDLILRRGSELRLVMIRNGEVVSTDTISQPGASRHYRFVGAGRVLTLRQDDPRFASNTEIYIPEEYGDFTDIMGPSTLRLGAFNQERLGLLDITRVSSPSPDRPAQNGSIICDPAAGYDLPAVYRYRLPGGDGPEAPPQLPSYLLIEYATIAPGRREPIIARVGEVAAVVNSTGNVIASHVDRSTIFRQAGHALLATDERRPGAQAGVIQPGSRDLPLPIGMDFDDVRVDITLPTDEPVIDPATDQPVRDPATGRPVADAGACAVVRIRPPCAAGLVARSDLRGDFACVTRERYVSFAVEAGRASQSQSTSHDGSRCNAGFVWRQATPEDRVCVTAASAELSRSENETPRSTAATYDFYGYHTCQSNYRWRMADRFDTVCVTSAEVERVMQENASAPRGGSCPAGLVWREAYASDRVCVSSARRQQVLADNLDAANRRLYQ